MLNKEAVIHVLSGINDPELRKSLTELGMVRFVNIDDGNVTVGITLTAPGCPFKEKIKSILLKIDFIFRNAYIFFNFRHRFPDYKNTEF